MKYGLKVVLFVSMLFSTAVIGDTRMERDAQNLVSQYLSALKQGDTELLLHIIGGDLLESRRTLLQNQNYSTYLTDVYAVSSMSISGSRQLSVNSVAVDVVIQRHADEQFEMTFLVKQINDERNKLKIVAEQDAESF